MEDIEMPLRTIVSTAARPASFFAGAFALAALLTVGCSSSSSGGVSTDAAGDAGGGGDSASDSVVAQGASLVKQNVCTSCHGKDLAGMVGIPGSPNMNAPNITPDSDTGIGGWTDAQVTAAIASGTDDEGKTLCSVMPRFGDLGTSDVAAIVAYLRSVPAVSKTIPDGVCPD